jgi:hypothetical protein
LEELDEQFVRQEEVRRHRPFESYEGSTTRARGYEHVDDAPDYENESQDSESLGVGKMVKHPQFGLGEIRAIEGRGENTKLTIEFEKAGAKKILLKYGNLQVLSHS